MVVTLIFMACVVGSVPSDCERVELPWSGSMIECSLFGQQAIAAWSHERPQRKPIGGYRCTTVQNL